ncbi:hypothetical protein GCM10014713_52490 [Streptomyces purpureus]|uniref:ABC transporter domain-containing protein n=1 Tax=Streptomyces purpureus TaxID=1951 RepID=A0A918HD73_9ACTN|nr:hypothetical protein GCM10014713_52490 [Streptomyces purpureus]
MGTGSYRCGRLRDKKVNRSGLGGDSSPCGRDSSPALAEALQRVGLAGRHKETVHRLSGGEPQRVALARLIVQQPKLVLADEPTAALDRDNTAMVLDSLREMSRAGCAVVIATHDDTVRDACDNVFALGTPLVSR